jgi:hypothetical protein
MIECIEMLRKILINVGSVTVKRLTFKVSGLQMEEAKIRRDGNQISVQVISGTESLPEGQTTPCSPQVDTA